MDFLILNFCLCVMCLFALPILKLGQKWLISSVASFFILALPEREPEHKSMFLTVAKVAVCGIAFLYIAGAWSAVCVATAQTIISREVVTWDWLYLVASFVWCVQVLLRGINLFTLYQRVTTETRAVWDQANLTFQSTFFSSFVICGLGALAWILFAIWPSLMLMLYGWALNPLIRALGGVDDLLKTYWWIPALVLSGAVIKVFFLRGNKTTPEWRSWGAELDRVVFMAQTFSQEWGGCSKPEVLYRLPRSWVGATAEDRGAFVVARNPGIFKYFEFHFMFGEPQDAPMTFLYVRGLQELRELWILVQAGEMALSLRPANGSSVSPDAKKAAKALESKFSLSIVE